MNKIAKIAIVVVLCLALVGSTVYCVINGNQNTSDNQVESYVETAEKLSEKAEKIISKSTKVDTISLNDKESTVSGAGAVVSDNSVNIQSSGVYTVSGTLTEGQISVDTSDDVTLIFDNANITNSNDAAINIISADHIQIYLKEGTENTITSGTETEINSETEADEAATGAAIYSKSDLSIAGSGKIYVNGYINNAIGTTENLVVLNGNITANAINNGLKGKKSVNILGGDLTIECGNDGIKSNDTDLGNIDIKDGAINITSYGDGISAVSSLNIAGGTINISSGDTSSLSEGNSNDSEGFDFSDTPTPPDNNTDFSKDDMMDFEPPDRNDSGSSGNDTDFSKPDMSNFDPTQMSDSDKPDSAPEIPTGGMGEGKDNFEKDNKDNQEANDTSASEDESSTKGIKCEGALTISNGEISVTSYDDSIHSNDTISITGSKITLESGDDGIHADNRLVIDNGEITISKSYEGIESHIIIINGGTINVTASDDGFNANGGTNSFGNFGGFKKEDKGSTSEEASTEDTAEVSENTSSSQKEDTSTNTESRDDSMPTLQITGGNIYVNANGDGLDSNGDIIIDGGYIIVDGPVSGGDGALDGGTENGGQILVNGGTIIAVGASGMAESFEKGSSQYSFITTLSEKASANSAVSIIDSNGNEIFSYTAAKSFSSVVFSSSYLKVGETYTVKVNDSETTVTVEEYSENTSSGFDGFGGFNNFDKNNKPQDKSEIDSTEITTSS